jgi:hypothetical protein
MVDSFSLPNNETRSLYSKQQLSSGTVTLFTISENIFCTTVCRSLDAASQKKRNEKLIFVEKYS